MRQTSSRAAGKEGTSEEPLGNDPKAFCDETCCGGTSHTFPVLPLQPACVGLPRRQGNWQTGRAGFLPHAL